jgi:hypothetical protein
MLYVVTFDLFVVNDPDLFLQTSFEQKKVFSIFLIFEWKSTHLRVTSKCNFFKSFQPTIHTVK